MRKTATAALCGLVIGLGCTGGPSGAPEGGAPSSGLEPDALAPVEPAPDAAAAPAKAPSTDDGLIDAAAYFNGGREVDPEGVVDANHAGALFDGVPAVEWACAKNEQRCDVIVELSEPFDLEKLVVIGPVDASSTVRKLAIETGPGAAGPWTAVATVEPAVGQAPQTFPIAAKGAAFVRLVPMASDNPDYYAIDDVQLRGKRSTTWPVDWTGTFIEASNSELEMKQQGERVTGCYGLGDRIEGVTDGPVFTGVYHDMEETVVDSRIVLVLRPDHGFHGVRSDSMDPASPLVNRFDGTWSGEAVNVSCDPPKDEVPSEIESALAKDGRVALYGVLFDFDKDTLKPESEKVLTALAAAIQSSDEHAFRIEGHTDDRGGQAYNLDLSDRRAKAVETWLVAHGVPDERLETQGFGDGVPVLPNTTAAGRAQNRRVEVAVIDQATANP